MKIQRDNVNIAYSEHGNGDISLLLVHGSFINKEYWSHQVKYFSKKYHVVTMDLGGHGESGKDRDSWTVEDFGKDVAAVIDQLRLNKVILIGHSLGGDAILEAAVANPGPIIGFIGIDNFKMAASPLPLTVQQQADNILESLRKDFAKTSENYARMVLLTKETDQQTTERIINDYRSAYPEMGVASLHSVFHYWQRERELLQQLPFKLHLINCDYFPTNEEPLKKYAGSGYEIISIHATSHFPMIEVPEQFNKVLEKTIEKILSDQTKVT